MKSGNERLDKAHDRLLETGWWELEFGESYQPSDEEILATYGELEEDIDRYRVPINKLAPTMMKWRRLKFKQLDSKAKERALDDYLEGLDETNPLFSFIDTNEPEQPVIQFRALGTDEAYDYAKEALSKTIPSNIKQLSQSEVDRLELEGTREIVNIQDTVPGEYRWGRTKGEIRTDLETEEDDLYDLKGRLTVVVGDPIMTPGKELLKALRDYSNDKMNDANTVGEYSDVDERKLLIAEAVAFEEAANELELKMTKRRVKKQLNRFREKYPSHPLLELMPRDSRFLESDILADLGYDPKQQVESLGRMLSIMEQEGVETIDPSFDKINFQLWYDQSENKMGPVNKTDYGKLPLKRKAAGNEWMRWYSDADGLDRLMKASERGESYIAYKTPNVRHVGTPNTNLSKSNFKFSRTFKDKWGRKRRYVSKAPGKGLVIWNNQELARLAAIRGRANGNWIRTIPVKEGWVNIAAPMKEDEYYLGTKNIPRTSFPSKKNLPKSIRREYFRRG
jgi:hypothetical protein